MMHYKERLRDLIRFYEILDDLAERIGGPRILAECNGRMEWPERGVYFFQEHGEIRTESGHGLRIVRVGTHALKAGSQTTLWNRLSQHRGSAKTGHGNHRGSIFRLLVGIALSSRNGLTVSSWGHGSSASKHVREKERPLEVLVSRTIGQMPFLWLDVPDSPGPDCRRGYIERNAIALLSNYNRRPVIDAPSPSWLGTHCNREKVRASGLWNQNHVDESYDPAFLDELEQLVRQMKRGNMKIVIQCAANKVPYADSLTDARGRTVLLVANPDLAPRRENCIYARPDDRRENGQTWREVLANYNATGGNPLGLLPAYKLYRHHIYNQLVKHYGIENVFILSAGWGLIRADFLIPKYDITFSAMAEKYKKRSKRDRYNDFRMLPDDAYEEVVFFGGKDYLPFFCNLTQKYRGRRFIFYNSSSPPKFPGCTFIRYQTTIRTNWHYKCAQDFMDGKIALR